jgi:carbonic anhydrase
MKVGGKEYTLVQYHFHAPSEHAFDGIRLPLEAHLVHKSKEGEFPYAIVEVVMHFDRSLQR